MDVSAITSGTGAPAPDVTDQPQAAQGGAAQAAQGSAAQPTTQGSASSSPSSTKDAALTSAISKLFGGSQTAALHVSYRVDGQDIVTVFTDPKTGKEVAQFPSEILLGLAKFFDHQGGVTLDQTA